MDILELIRNVIFCGYLYYGKVSGIQGYFYDFMF